MTTKRQQTMAKITRERAVKEKRERKLEKKRAAKAERKALAAGGIAAADVVEGEDSVVEGEDSGALLDPHEADGDDGSVLSERVVPGL